MPNYAGIAEHIQIIVPAKSEIFGYFHEKYPLDKDLSQL